MGKRPPREGEGRPSKYTVELATAICERIAKGESLRKICRDDDMPDRNTVHEWLLDETKDEFYRQYEKAVNTRTENMFDELEDIADNTEGDVQRDRLRVDTRKWYLSKVMPKKYGDKLDLSSGGEKLQPILVKFIGDDNRDTNRVS